jgi:hypothetical protein
MTKYVFWLSDTLDRLSSVLLDNESTQGYRQRKLVTRFNDLFAVDRRNAMDILRQFTDTDDLENHQRIVFAAIQVESIIEWWTLQYHQYNNMLSCVL